MTHISCRYTGDLHCQALHGPSGVDIHTDAPTDHDGRGESFSPTDLLATALGTCILTVMGITAKRRNWTFNDAEASVEKNYEPKGSPKNRNTSGDDHFAQWAIRGADSAVQTGCK